MFKKVQCQFFFLSEDNYTFDRKKYQNESYSNTDNFLKDLLF